MRKPPIKFSTITKRVIPIILKKTPCGPTESKLFIFYLDETAPTVQHLELHLQLPIMSAKAVV